MDRQPQRYCAPGAWAPSQGTSAASAPTWPHVAGMPTSSLPSLPRMAGGSGIRAAGRVVALASAAAFARSGRGGVALALGRYSRARVASSSVQYSTSPPPNTALKPGFAPGTPAQPAGATAPAAPPPGIGAQAPAGAKPVPPAPGNSGAAGGGGSGGGGAAPGGPGPAGSGKGSGSWLGWIVPAIGLPTMAALYYQQQTLDRELDEYVTDTLHAVREIMPPWVMPARKDGAKTAPPAPTPAPAAVPAQQQQPKPAARESAPAAAPKAPAAPAPKEGVLQRVDEASRILEVTAAAEAQAAEKAQQPAAPAPAAADKAAASAAAGNDGTFQLTPAVAQTLHDATAGLLTPVAGPSSLPSTAPPAAPVPTPAPTPAPAPAPALQMSAADTLAAAVDAARAQEPAGAERGPLPAGLPEGMAGSLGGFDLSPVGLVRHAIEAQGLGDWTTFPHRHAQAKADAGRFEAALKVVSKWHSAQVAEVRQAEAAAQAKVSQLQAGGKRVMEYYESRLKAQQAAASELMAMEVRQAEKRTGVEAERVRQAEAEERLAALDELRQKVNELRAASEAVAGKAADSTAVHALTLGAAAVAAAAEAGGALRGAAAGLLRGVRERDPLVGAVLEVLPEGPVATRSQLSAQFRALRPDLAALSYFPDSSSGMLAVLVARMAGSLKIDEARAVRALGVAGGGVDAALAQADELLAAGQLSEAADLLQTSLDGTAAAALAREWVEAVQRRTAADIAVAALNAHAAAISASLV